MVAERMEMQIQSGYDYHKSTRDNYALSGDGQEENFVGEFADIRRKTDSRWHGNYPIERQVLQDALVRDVLGLDSTSSRTTDDSRNPWIIFTGGAMGAGKGYTMNWMRNRNIIPIANLRHIDPDVFKRRLPEWKHYVRNNPTTAGSFTHLESSLLVEIAQEAALQRNMNIWVDGSLSNDEWTLFQLNRIRRIFPQYHIAVVHVSASERTVMQRCERRAKSTGRVVPADKIGQSLHASRRTIDRLSPPLVDVVVQIRNEASSPELVSINTMPVESDAWGVLRNFFISE